MINQDKQYIVVSNGETYRFSDADWTANKDEFMKDNPSAEIAEVDRYSVDDSQEGDFISVMAGGQSYGFNVNDWNANQEEFLKDFPDAQPYRMRGVDYHYNQALSLEEALADNKKRKEAWEARRKEGMSGASLAEIAALEAGLDPVVGTFSEGAAAAQAYLDEGRQIEEERIRLQEQYDNNPRVKEAQEKWDKEQAEYKAQYPQLLREQINKDYEEFLGTVPKAFKSETMETGFDDVNLGEAIRMLTKGKEYREQQFDYEQNEPLFRQALIYLDDAEKIANAPSVADETNGFVKYLKSMGDRFSEVDFWSRGLAEAGALASGGDRALNKFQQLADEKGENLTEEDINAALSPAERAYVLALTHKIAVQAERANEFASDDVKLSRAYNIGRGTADMVGYMAEFLLSGNISGGASKAATNAVAKWLVKNGVSRLTKSAIKGTVGKAAAKAIGKNALKGASKVLTSVLSKSAGAVAGGAARTPFTLSLAGNIADRRTSMDENGRFHGMGEAALYGTFDTAVENFSEEMGGAIGDVLGLPFKAGKGAWKAMTRNVDFGKIGGVAAKAGDFAQRVANSKAFAFLKNAGFHGPLEEVGEEFVGAAVRDVTIEPEAWEQTANKESIIDLMVTFAPMTALGMVGTAGQMIHVSNEAKSKMDKLAQMMLAKGFDQQQVDYLTDYMRSTTPEELRQEMVGIWTKMANESGLGANVMQSEIGKAVIEAAYATAQYQTLFGAKQAQEAQQREAKKAELEEKYNGKFYGEDGMVRRHTLSNGKTVFQISNFGENGEAAAIDAKTGEHIVFKESDIAVETDKEGKQHKRSDSQTLDSYLSGEVMALNTTWEYARMQKDRQDQINALAQSLPAAINLGTQGDSKMAPVKEYNAQGVTVVDENGDEIALTWEQVGQKLGKPIKVLTDAEIAEIEAQEIAMRSNERRAGRAQTQQEVADTEAEINDTNKRIADLTPNPEEAYRNQETGEIDEDAFWENDPEGWADYNDRMMMDNGQDSMEQIESGLTLLAKQMSELDKMKSDSPNARKTIKAQKANLQAKIDRLVALQQKYVQASISEEQRKVELTLALRERVAEWRKRLGLNEEGLVVFESIEDVINSPYLSEKEKADVLEVIGRGKTEGWYNTASTRAFVFLPDINTTEELDKTIAHEVVTHYGLHNLMGEKSYNELMDKVWDTMSDAARNAYYNYAGVASMQDADKRRRAAAEEFVASIAENVSLGQATAEQKSIWQRIVEFFRNLFKESNFSDLDIADIVRKNYQQLTEQAAQESVEEFKAEAQEQRENGIIPELIETEAQQADGTKLYSTATYHSWVDNLGHEHTGTREEVLTRMQNMGFSEAEIEDMAQRMDTAYAYMEKLRRLTNPDGTVRFDEFNKWAEKTPLYKQIGRDYVKAITSLVSNGDYPVNLEITTDCIKREAFTQLLNELVKRGAELSGMGPGEIVTIQKMMKQYGIEVACNLCFVEGKRLQIINWASQIVNDWNDALVEAGVETDEFFEFGKDGDAFIPADEWRTYEDKSKVAKVMRNLDDIALLFQGLDPKTFKAQKRKNKKALDKYIKEKAEKAKKPVDQWKPSDEQKREMKKIANEGLYPTYVNENMEEYRNAFNAMRNEWLDKNPNADPLSFNPTQKQWEALGKIRNRQIDNVRAKMVRLIMEYPEMRKKMTLNDLLGSKGLMEIRQQHGQAYADLYSIILQRFGTGTPKPVQDAVPYDGEVMTLSESAFKKANEIGGARLFSFSDFDITKVFDYMQMFFDLEANRQMLQSYTKEVAAVLIFGRSNAKFNISTLANAIVPDSVKEEYNKASEEKKQELRHKWAEYAGLEVDAEGNIIGINFSEEHSVSPAFAQQIFHDDSRNKDCGAIMVGASVNHAIFSAAQQWIRMVIPFHLSGMPLAAREKTDVKWYTDNTAYQSTRKKTKDGWSKISSSEDTFKFYNDMSKEGWNMRDKTREYLAWCAEKGFRPKFDWGINSDYYRAYCEENGYTPNQQIIDIMDADTTDGVWNQYYKFLTDFTAYKPVFNEQGEMIDEIPSPQLPVQSNFDFSEMEKDVLFEGERSMLEHREGNIQRTNRHIEILAEQATAYLNGDITEEEMGLRDDVHFENTADAERYLEEVAKENGTNMYKTRTDSEREKLFADAKEKFGVTNNFKVAGYMLPDGSLLDFSEANDGGDPNQRSLDHRSIEDVIMEDGTEYDSRWMYLADFMNEGAIRLLPEYAGINLMKAPTKEQRQRLMDFIYKYNGEVILEIADERLNNAAYVEYDRRTSPARIFRDIDGYFNEGIVPQSNTMFKTANNNQAIFVSNAAKAVEGIKMEKATPEQWLKMIEKNGGLKAGEDKWMGLSDFLKASDKKTLTKQEVLDFINENMIVIEEQHYGVILMEDREDALHDNMIKTYGQDFYDRFVGDAFIFEDSLYGGDWHLSIQFDDTAADLYNEYNEDKVDYNEDEGGLSIQDKEKVRKWATAVAREMEAVDEVRQINPTRKKYSTGGLRNHHEIALTIPTIESWNKGDDVHFGDAGEGRAVAWIRFGDGVALIHTEASKELHNEVKARLAQLREKYGEDSASWSEEEREQLFDLIDAARKAKRESKVLVIDEIQSQRHQDAKDGGYRTKVDEKQYKEKIKAVSEKQNVLLDYIGTLVQKYPNTDYDIEDVFKNFGAFSVEEKEELKRLKEEYDAAYAKTLEIGKGLEDRIPEAPFEKNWAELAMKRMLRYAAENGYDAIAWTEGEQQVRRYQSLYDYESISVGKWKTYDGAKKRSVDVLFKDGTPLNFGIDEKGKITRGRYKGEKLTSVLSKEVSKKIMAAEGEVVLTGEDLTFGEGMKHFYDKMLPSFMNKYGKKWGVSVDSVYIKDLGMGLNMHSVPVTEEMKESVMEGQTMFKTKHPQEFAKQFMEGVVNDFYNTYETAAPASVVYVKNRRMVEEALGFGKGEMPDWLYERVKEEAKGSGAYLVNMQFQKEDGTEENRRRILIFAKEDYRMSADVDRIIFHENTHGWILDHPELLELGKWLAQSDNKTIQRVVGWVKDAYKEESWANEMLSDYVGRMLSIGKGQMALDLIPDEYKPLLINIYEKFGYRPEQEDGRRVAELIRDAETLQMRDSELGEPGSNKTLFKTGISPEVRKEMDVISATAIVNGNYMKAPNGKDSKLTPDQWALVRTQNFLNWFGDWINDPENASKVVDENGEPLVIWRGMSWDIMAEPEGEAVMNDSSYFSNKAYVSRKFGDYAYPYFMNARNPYIMNAGASDWASIPIEYAEGLEVEPYDEEYPDETGIGDIAIAAFEKGYDAVWVQDVGDMGGIADQLLNRKSNQIKAADNNTGEFSAEDDDIRFRTADGNKKETANFVSSMDSKGNALTQAQQDFFANSKAVDKDGNLLVLYHGTPRAGFTEFKSGWFTTSKEDAISYSGDRKGRMFDPNEKYEPETLSAGDFRLGYMTFDSEEDRAAFIAEHPTAESAMSESEYENARIQAEDEEYDTLTERKPELQKIWDAYREYERDHFVDTTIGEILNNPDAYTEDDLRRAVLAYDSNAVFDSIDELETTEERKSALVDSLNYMNEDAKENGAEGILDMVVATRVPRNGEGIKHNDLGNRTYEVYARIESPYEIDANGRGSEFESGDIYQSVKDALADEQYDGVIIRNWRVGRHQQLGDVVVPKNGKQVKLTSNENPTESENTMFKTVYGGNRGYVGYSMSKRAAEARSEGRYPKTDFRKEYNVTAPALDLLVYCGIIDGSEWHHTSMYGNKTKFYGWYEDEYADIYQQNKKEIDALAREFKKKTEEYRGAEKAIRARLVAGEITPQEELELSLDADKEHNQYEREVQDKIDAIFNPVEPDGSGDETTLFKTRTAPAPTKTQEVYKLMRLGADGKLYPLFIGSAEPIELGTWYDAESPNLGDLTKLASGVHLVNNETGEAMTLEEFKAQHPEITIKGKRPNVAAINWATENGARWIEIEDKATAQRRYEGESRSYYNLGINGSGQVGQFAMRPGWHAGSLPTMRQIGKGKDKNLRDDSFVWVKGRIPADVDYQAEADANPDKDIPTHIPTDGFYMKATNANAKASQADKMGWYVAGSFIADEIISDADARSVIDSWNAEHPDAQVEYDYERESGREYDPKRGGLVEKEGTTLFKTTAKDYAAMPVDELVEKGKMRVSAENQLASDEFMNRIRAINGSLNQLRMAASAQRKYDKNTVQILASLANDLLASGKIADPSKGEVKRLISVLSNATGQNDLTKYVDRLMDIMIANQLRHGRENFDQFLRIRGKKVDARGVEVKGRLDIPGQQIMDAIRANIGLDLVDILFNIIETEDKLTSESETIRRNAENELIGLEFAKQYVENIRQSENEEKALRKEVKDAEAEYKAGARDRKSYTDFVKVTDEAIRENRTQRVLAYQKLIDDLAKMVTSSVQGSKLFNEAEKARVAKIQHFANSDMQGMPADAHVEAESKFWNNGLVRLFTSPLATFEQWLRVFGAKSAEGKGYLYNHFMGSWAKATDQMYLGMKDANAALDAKAREVFGNKVDKWSDLFAMEKELSKGKKYTISFWDDGEMKEYEVTQGNLLYIYMVNKMIDGKMKLRKMGISEDDVDAIVREIDPRFIALADWIQEEFLPGIRDKYNAVHERLFGAPMAAIDNYFPIKVLANARVREVDLGTAESSSKPSTITGSIIKRTKNGLALDVLHSDAFDVVLEHIEQMEQWAAFAEFNRDLNTLLSYKKFRNRVQNMSGVLGAGKEAWNSFRETAEIAAGVYQPKTAKADKLVTNAVKGLTAGKISFRLWTALKQVLAMPAFLPYVNPAQLIKRMATPWESWNWAMENLPAFEKRWKSREAGNVRLKKTEADYKIWQGDFMETATRLGMTPNAFVDAVSCAIGSHAVYLTQKERYEREGYSEEQAIKKAKLDATVAFNATQQSSESAFLSAVQSDRTFIAHALTVFRNNSFGMQRELVDALRNFKKRMKSGFKAESIEFMKKQMVRDGLTEEQAERAANRVYRNSVIKDAARVATFGFLMQFLWNIGGSAIYLLFGDDDEEKEQMIKDAAIRGAFGSIEGLGFGNVITEGLSMAITGDLKKFHPSLSPAGADIETLWNEMLTDPVAGANELINILVQAGIGVNPQVLTDAVVAIVDACDGDIEKSKEVGIALLRILQVPQSQIDKLKTDEIDFTNDIGLDITIEEFAKEYAQYKKWRNAPLTNALYSDEKERKVEDKYIKRFLKDAEALKRTRGNEEAKAYYQYLDTEYKEVSETINNLNRQTKEAGMKGDMVGSMEFAKMLDDFTKTDAFKRYVDFGGKAKAIESLRDKMKKVDMKTRTTIEDAMLDLRKEMVEEMEQAIN